MNKPWINDFYFDLFKGGQIASYYSLPVRNILTDDVILEEGHGAATSSEEDVFVIQDIPEFIALGLDTSTSRYKVSKIRQYKGYLVHLSPFKNLDAYLAAQLSSRNRKKLRSKKRKLEAAHKIRYAFYYGAIEKQEYHHLFDAFYDFLEKRFKEKEIINNNLRKWDYYRELILPMVLEKRASLFVIYADERPVTIGMQFHLSRTVFSYVQSYDLDFSQYNMGDISAMKRLEWCFEQGFDTFDLSVGETDYKVKWCNHPYNLYYHVFYDSKSPAAFLKSRSVILKLRFKQYLRDKDIIGGLIKMDKLRYKIRQLSGK